MIWGCDRTMRYLVDHGANVNAMGYEGIAIISAATRGRNGIICYLCENGVDVNFPTSPSQAPIDKALSRIREARITINRDQVSTILLLLGQ